MQPKSVIYIILKYNNQECKYLVTIILVQEKYIYNIKVVSFFQPIYGKKEIV